MSKGKANQKLALLDEPAAGRLTIQYAPDEATEIVENPPRFSWLPVIEDEAEYVIRIAPTADYSDADTAIYSGIKLNFFTPDTACLLYTSPSPRDA